MNLNGLKIFCEAVRLNSFSLAAEENLVTQSTVSQTIAHLEKHYGVSLIDRSRRPWQITQEGKLLYKGALELVKRFEDLENEVKGAPHSAGTQIRLACIYSVGIGRMSRLIDRFQQANPLTKISLVYLHPARIMEKVVQHKIDMGILSYPRPTKNLSCISLFSESMVIACPPRHKCARLKMVFLHQLQNEPFIAFSSELPIRHEVDNFLKSNQVTVKTVLEFDNVESIKRAVEAGSGISILPRPSLKTEVGIGSLAAVGFSPESFSRPLGIIHLRGRAFNRDFSRFIEFLKQAPLS